MKYVAFCDVLGFSSAVQNDFNAAIAVYQEFKRTFNDWPFPEQVQVSVYSDSILVVGNELPPVLHAVGNLNWATLLHDWLIRGGIAYGKYWEEKDNGNLFVVSEALVEAVSLEKSIKVPAVAVSNQISLGIEAWVPRFQHGVTQAPLLHFRGHNVVNPFSPFWFKTAVSRVERLLKLHPDHKEKYEWFLSLADAVANDELLVPEPALNRMLELGILQKAPPHPILPTQG